MGSHPGAQTPVPSSGGIYMPVQQRPEVRLLSAGDLIRLGECMPHTILKINKRKQNGVQVDEFSTRVTLSFIPCFHFFPHPCLTDIFFPKPIQPALLWNLTSWNLELVSESCLTTSHHLRNSLLLLNFPVDPGIRSLFAQWILCQPCGIVISSKGKTLRMLIKKLSP